LPIYEKEKKGLDHQEISNNEIAKEIAHENIQGGHEEL
jgi:hypothetical protein